MPRDKLFLEGGSFEGQLFAGRPDFATLLAVGPNQFHADAAAAIPDRGLIERDIDGRKQRVFVV